MNLKDELLKLKKDKMQTNQNKKDENDIRIVNLDDKVDMFIKWYYENMVKDNYTDIGEYHKPIEMRNFIEKMAVWYELRYPDYEINRLMHCCGQEQKEINEIMFKDNYYIKDLIGIDSDIKDLDWHEFFSANAFIKSLPIDEKYLLSRPWYSSICYLNRPKYAHLHLTKNGYVTMSEGITIATKSKIEDEELVGLHLRKAVELFKERNVELPFNNDLEVALENANKWAYQKEELLNCVMYRIIERGGNRIGPRRAFLFAKEFKRNIDIPMMYAVDRSDPGLREFTNEYLKAGGHTDLECYVGYFHRASKDEPLDTITANKLLLTQNNNALTFYTPEEHELHQRLVDTIASQVDYSYVRETDVKKLRLEKKIEKSRKR